MKSKIFIAGGGSPEDSEQIDKAFSKNIKSKSKIGYIPIAMKPQKFESCEVWFRGVYEPLGLENITMLTDMNTDLKNYEVIYVGGGNTTRLLKGLRNSDKDSELKERLDKNNFIFYGGSAGAILLGKSILTAPESRELSKLESKSLDVLVGHSVYCHFDPRDPNDAIKMGKELGHNIIALSETSGALIEDNLLTAIGTSVFIIEPSGEMSEVTHGTQYQL